MISTHKCPKYRFHVVLVLQFGLRYLSLGT
jgi:hypothetical protein